MHLVGRVIEIWRYPVSSVAGELIANAEIDPDGIAGDRQYALIDVASGRPAAPEKEARWRRAVYLRAITEGEATRIAFPGGQSCLLNDVSLNARLSDYFGFDVAIASYNSSEQHLGIRTTANRYRPFAVHLLTTSSIKHIAALREVETVDSRRFRPSVLVEVIDGDGFIENQWVAKAMRLGPVALTGREQTKRCGMTVIQQPGIDEDPEILRTILRHNKRNLGIYCTVESPGTIQPGDPFFIE